MRTSSQHLVERLLAADGQSLAGWRADGLSLAAIVRRLHDDYDITVSTETIRRWTETAAVPS